MQNVEMALKENLMSNVVNPKQFFNKYLTQIRRKTDGRYKNTNNKKAICRVFISLVI
ncbi:unnamed protein product [marine sediment metagenome]|uniref:Uncharacterized protein n=1 Tax=marine sediment metagenome TaxID=412755 RepID=X1DEJ3_9ZZZZ